MLASLLLSLPFTPSCAECRIGWNFHFIYFAHLHYAPCLAVQGREGQASLVLTNPVFIYLSLSLFAGFAGELCNFEYNECESNPCQNAGECIDHIGSFECRCTKGYTGNRCQIKVSAKRGPYRMIKGNWFGPIRVTNPWLALGWTISFVFKWIGYRLQMYFVYLIYNFNIFYCQE